MYIQYLFTGLDGRDLQREVHRDVVQELTSPPIDRRSLGGCGESYHRTLPTRP